MNFVFWGGAWSTQTAICSYGSKNFRTFVLKQLHFKMSYPFHTLGTTLAAIVEVCFQFA